MIDVAEIPLDIPDDCGHISSICCGDHGANLYVGTTTGHVCHFHQFDDAANYILIMVATTSDHPAFRGRSLGVKKLMILPTVSRLLVVLELGAVVGYGLPELSPWSLAALALVNDITLLRHQRRVPTVAATDDKIVAFTPAKIRVMAVGKDHIHGLKDIAYLGLIKGVLLVGLSQNYSNLVLVANLKNYDVIDLQKTRKIPMGDYRNGDATIDPFIEGYRADGDGRDEYMLTIRSEGQLAVAMFVDLLGDATRGTILMDSYPQAIAVNWPYIYGVFGDQLVVYSLLLLVEVTRLPLFAKDDANDQSHATEAKDDQTHNIEANQDIVPQSEHGDQQTTGSENELREDQPKDGQDETSEDDQAKTESKDKKSEDKKSKDKKPKEMKAKDEFEDKLSQDDQAKDESKDDFEDESKDESKDKSKEKHSTESEDKKSTDKKSKDEKSKDEESKDEESNNEQPEREGQLEEDKQPKPEEPLKQPSELEENQPDQPEATSSAVAITQTPLEMKVTTHTPVNCGVVLVDDLPFISNDRLTHVELVSGTEIATTAITKNHAHIAAFHATTLWAIYEPDDFDALVDRASIEELTSALDSHSGERHDYVLQLLVLQLLKHQQFDQARPYLTRIKAGKLIVHPLLVILALAVGQLDVDSTSDLATIITEAEPVIITKGLRNQLRELLPFPTTDKAHQFVESYLKEVYKIIPHMKYIRRTIYALQSQDDVDWVNGDNWGEDEVGDEYCIAQLADKRLHTSLLAVYRRLGRINDYCELSLLIISLTTDTEKLHQVVESVLTVLPQVKDEDVYLKVLVEVVKVDKPQGYAFLRDNRDQHHKLTNHKILASLTTLGDDDDQLLVLRLEYMEDSMVDAVGSGDELVITERALALFHHLVALIQGRNADDDTVPLFDTLVQTYAIANAVSEPWPKVTWPDFVRLQARQLKILEVLTWYGKAYEVYVYLCRHHHPPPVPQQLLVFHYFEATRSVAQLLAFSDFPQAEHVAVYGHLAPPTTPYYSLPTSPHVVTGADPNRDDLKQILSHYLQLRPHTYSIPHFLGVFGSVFDPIDLLHCLPATLSLVHVVEYCQRVVVDLDSRTRQTGLTKLVAKTEARTLGEVWSSLTSNHLADS